jgi:hypothetical protein
VRARFRELAREHHPDTGGDGTVMAEVLDAYRRAVATAGSERGTKSQQSTRRRFRPERDTASFTVAVLPVEAFEALRLVVLSIGDLVDENPPYSVEFLVRQEPVTWCRCDLVPDAGSTTVSVAVEPAADEPWVRVEQMRDVLVGELNRLNW